MDRKKQERTEIAFSRLVELAESGDESGLAFVQATGRYTVGLFWLDNQDIDIGSGLLVECEGEKFIMTCSHTLRQPREGAGLCLYYGQEELEANGRKLIADVRIVPEKQSEATIDVGAAKLTEVAIEELASYGKSFYRLDRQVLSPPIDEEPCILVGYPDACVADPEVWIEDGTRVAKYKFQAAFVEAVLEGEAAIGNRWKFLRFGKSWPKLENFHHSVKGMSGGGVWQYRLLEDDKRFTLINEGLIGIQCRTSRDGPSAYLLVEKVENWIEGPCASILDGS